MLKNGQPGVGRRSFLRGSKIESGGVKRRRQRVLFEALEGRALLSTVFISEVHPSGSGNGTYGADWIEVTNSGTAALDVSGWRMDDNSNAFASSVPLRGVTSIPAGKSAVFFENSTAG